MFFSPKQFKQRSLVAVVGTSRVAESWTDGAVIGVHQTLVGHRIVIGEPPQRTDALMQRFSRSLRKSVGNGFDHDRVVIVVIGFVVFSQRLCTVNRHGEGANMIVVFVAFGSDEVSQTSIVNTRIALLAKETERVFPISGDDEVFSSGPSWPKPSDGFDTQAPRSDDLVEHPLTVLEHVSGGFTLLRVFEDAGVRALHVPSREEEIPIDERHELLKAQLKRSNAVKRRGGRRGGVERQSGLLRSRLVQRQQGLGHFSLEQRC